MDKYLAINYTLLSHVGNVGFTNHQSVLNISHPSDESPVTKESPNWAWRN